MALVLGALLAAGCSYGNPGSLSPSTGPTASLAACVQVPPANPTPSGSTDLATKPTIEITDTPPPCNLVVGDLVLGAGAGAAPGQTLTVKYVGVTYQDGVEFDTSWGNGDFTFLLGGGEVIPGWDQGFVGMQVGGRRQLVIPPELGYGAKGAGPIPPNAPLIFVVDLVSIA